MDENFKGTVTTFRNNLGEMVQQLASFKDAVSVVDTVEGENRGEVLANITLALRHVEDASMRLGKVIQARQGGVSPLGGPNTPGTHAGNSILSQGAISRDTAKVGPPIDEDQKTGI